MAVAMRKYGVCAAFVGCLALCACQVFTAGEPVSEPDPALARKQRDELANKAHGANPHGANPHGANPHGAQAKEGGDQGEMATASHILIRYAGATRTTPDMTRSKEDARKLAEEVANKARAPGADFAALANEYTEDPSGKGRGGKLGTFPKGRMVPEFDKPLFALKPGEVSDVIETPFGFHVIMREK